MKLQLRVLPNEHSICQYQGEAPFDWVRQITSELESRQLVSGLWSLTRTPTEWSLVCETSCQPANIRGDSGWRVITIEAQMDLDIVGVLASLLEPLKSAGVSIFALSTFDTDFVLVRSDHLVAAVRSLQQAGFEFLD
ncbi:MAG: ACT domain-containing protein [Pirellulaceae bacterium]